MTGSGTLLDPYIIYDITDFQNINNDLTAYYELANDIDASATSGWNGGAGFVPIGFVAPSYSEEFTGSLNGKRHVITDIFESFTYASIFLVNNGTIEEIGFEGINFTSASAGCNALAYVNKGLIKNSYINGSLTGYYITAPFYGNLGTIENFYSNCSLHTTWSGLFAGLCWTNSGTFTSCYWDTDVSGVLTSDGGVGKTTAEMKKQATFVGWDFATIWQITEDVTYPTFIPSAPPVSPSKPFNNNSLMASFNLIDALG